MTRITENVVCTVCQVAALGVKLLTMIAWLRYVSYIPSEDIMKMCGTDMV